MEAKNELQAVSPDMTFYPIIVTKNEVNTANLTKLPIAGISALGAAFEPLKTAFRNVITKGGGETNMICKVTIPPGCELAKFRDGSGYLGTVLDSSNKIKGQARINPLVCDPMMMFMAAALMNIERKLDEVIEIQKEILEFLVQKEKAKQRGNLQFLTDIMDNYKFNRNNDKYKNNNHIKVLDIKQEAEQSILFYKEQISRKIKNQGFLHSDGFVNGVITAVQSEFKEYQLALYLYAFSAFLEVMLLENFESAYLYGVIEKIKAYELGYDEYYNECCGQIEGYSKSSVQANLLSGLANMNKAAGNAVSKISFLSKTKIDKTLTETGERLGEFSAKRTSRAMERLVSGQGSITLPFIENVKTLDKLYNKPVELLFDDDYIYIDAV
jgi:hypothetical protein